MRFARRTHMHVSFSIYRSFFFFFHSVWFALSTARTSARPRALIYRRDMFYTAFMLYDPAAPTCARLGRATLSRIRWWNDKTLPEERRRRDVKFNFSRDRPAKLLSSLYLRHALFKVSSSENISLVLMRNFIWNIDLRFKFIPVYNSSID